MQYFVRLAKVRRNYTTAIRELSWRSYARVRGWFDYEAESLPWFWPFRRWAYHTYYDFIHRKDVIPHLPTLRVATLRHVDPHTRVNWTYSRELYDHEPATHAKTIDLFSLEQKWGKKIILTGWVGKRVYPGDWPDHLNWDDYADLHEEGQHNSRSDDLPGWEHFEYSKMIMIRKGR